MGQEIFKVQAKKDAEVVLKVQPGHFATPQSHITHYLDMTTMRTRCREAQKVARVLAGKYEISTPVDTIVCLDGMEIIGAYLAEELSKAGVLSMNAHKTIYVVTPEYTGEGQMIFRDNLKPMIQNKNVVLLNASITTGNTLHARVDTILYYGGILQGISSVFSAITKMAGMEINTIFDKADIPKYETYRMDNCPMCKARQKLDALVNGHGYSAL